MRKVPVGYVLTYRWSSRMSAVLTTKMELICMKVPGGFGLVSHQCRH